MTTNENNKFGAKLNFRGKTRQTGVRTLDYLRVNGKQNIIIIGATIVLFLLFTLINPNYARQDNLVTMIKSFAPYAILGLGVTFVIATGGIDLSIGTGMFAASVIAGAICKTSPSHNTWAVIPIMLAVGLFFGLLNGFLVAKCKLPPFIATLGTMLFSKGISAVIAQVITKSTTAIIYPPIGWMQDIFLSYNGFPVALLWVLALTVICMIIMFKTRVGRYILSIGSNEEATRLSGVNVDKYKIIAYAIGGLFAGIAAIFWAATNPSITPGDGGGKELDAIAGVYIGGTSTTGGSASIVGTIFGAIILVIIRQGLNLSLNKLPIKLNATFLTYAVTGVIVVGAVLLDIMKKKAASSAKKELSAVRYKRKANEKLAALNVEKDYALSAKDNEEAKKRVEEIDLEIATIKTDLKEKLPVLKAEDKRLAEEERKHKAEIKAAEKAEKAKIAANQKAEKENENKNK